MCDRNDIRLAAFFLPVLLCGCIGYSFAPDVVNLNKPPLPDRFVNREVVMRDIIGWEYNVRSLAGVVLEEARNGDRVEQRYVTTIEPNGGVKPTDQPVEDGEIYEAMIDDKFKGGLGFLTAASEGTGESTSQIIIKDVRCVWIDPINVPHKKLFNWNREHPKRDGVVRRIWVRAAYVTEILRKDFQKNTSSVIVGSAFSAGASVYSSGSMSRFSRDLKITLSVVDLDVVQSADIDTASTQAAASMAEAGIVSDAEGRLAYVARSANDSGPHWVAIDDKESSVAALVRASGGKVNGETATAFVRGVASGKKTIEAMQLATLKRFLESRTEGGLKQALEVVDLATLRTSVRSIDLPTLQVAIRVVDNPTLKHLFEEMDEPTLKNALAVTQADRLDVVLGIVDAPTRDAIRKTQRSGR